MSDDHREQPFDRALARHLPHVSPHSRCPDAETLAAYHERTLSLQEMAQSKEHVRACSRCQQILALLEQTEGLSAAEAMTATTTRAPEAGNPQSAETLPFAAESVEVDLPVPRPRPRPPWRWMVPVGAIAAGVILIIGVQEIHTQRARQAYQAQVAENRTSMPAMPSPQRERLGNLKNEESPVAKLDKVAPPAKKAAASPPAQRSAENASSLSVPPASVPAAASPTAGELSVNDRKEAFENAAGGAAPRQPPTSAYLARSRAAAAPPGVTADANRPAEEKAQSVKPAGAVAATVEAHGAATLEATASELEITALKDTRGDLLQMAATDRHYIVAPGEMHAWRVGDAGKIERTTDRGKTWKRQTSGVLTDLTAGSATSDKVCWVVGKAGALLLTTDGGQRWKLLRSPIPEDLGGVHAIDAAHASIWNLTNRASYETSDGGVTWQRTAND